MMRLNKLDRLSLETLSSQVLEFEGKARADPIGAPFRCFLPRKLLLFPANVIPDWKVIAGYKHCSLFCLIDSDERRRFYNIDTRSFQGLPKRILLLARWRHFFVYVCLLEVHPMYIVDSSTYFVGESTCTPAFFSYISNIYC